MAQPPPPSLLLLFVLLLNPSAAVSIASPPSPCPSQSTLPPPPPLSTSQPPLTPSHPPSPPPLSPPQTPPLALPQPHPPPPPPLFRLPPPTTRATPQQMDRIVDALIGSGDFGSWINTITTANPITLPLSATVFVPENLAATASSSRQNQNPNPGAAAAAPPDPFLLPYHVVPQRLTIADLRLFKTGSRLPTLLPSKSILVTANSDSNFTLDGADVTQPDVYVTANVVVHGAATVLDYAVYGDATTTKPPKQECPPPPPQRSPPPPSPLEEDEALPRAAGVGVSPDWKAGGVRARFPVGFAAACVVLLLRYRIL